MLKQRIVTAVLGITAILLVMAWGVLPWRAVVWLGTVLGGLEFTAMLGFRWRNPLTWYAGAVITAFIWWPVWPIPPIVWQLTVAIALLWPVASRNRVLISQSATVLVGALYLAFGGASLAQLRTLPRGWAWLLLLLICIWLTDSVAFFVGKWLQGPKLWPSISPRKTISGAVGGVFGAAAGAVILGYLTVPGFDVFAYAALGAVISIAGQLGDLVESAYKRSANVKDSGRLLPGHGGMLDRVDGLLFAAPFAYYLITNGAASWFR